MVLDSLFQRKRTSARVRFALSFHSSLEPREIVNYIQIRILPIVSRWLNNKQHAGNKLCMESCKLQVHVHTYTREHACTWVRGFAYLSGMHGYAKTRTIDTNKLHIYFVHLSLTRASSQCDRLCVLVHVDWPVVMNIIDKATTEKLRELIKYTPRTLEISGNRCQVQESLKEITMHNTVSLHLPSCAKRVDR